MASNKILEPSFNWGDVVMVKLIAPERYKPGFRGCICGIRNIDSLETALEFDQKIGSKLYLIEFANGEALEIPSFFLNLIDSETIDPN